MQRRHVLVIKSVESVLRPGEKRVYGRKEFVKGVGAGIKASQKITVTNDLMGEFIHPDRRDKIS